jgi:beta-lactamase regulating signal transducer with metallopeptidase domain
VDALLNWLWQGGVVAVAGLGMLRVLGRAGAAVRCLLCWAALLLITILPAVAAVTAAVSPVGPTVTAPAIITVPSSWWTSSAVMAAAWAIWIAVYAVRLARAVVVVRRARARIRPFLAAVEPRLMHWGRIRAAGRPARLVLSDRVQAAAVFGCGKPVIAVAPALVERLDPEDLDRVVIHEWAHVQRRDDLAKLAQLLVRAVAGWHPAVWWLDRRLSIEQELACDEMVVTTSGAAKAYASCLVKLASLRGAHSEALLATGALSSAGLGRRVTHLLTRRTFVSPVWSRKAAITVVALLFVVALGIAPMSFVEAAVSTTVTHVLHPVAQAGPDAANAAVTVPSATARLAERRENMTAGVTRAEGSIHDTRISRTDAPGSIDAEVGIRESSQPAPSVDAKVLETQTIAVPLVTSAPPLPIAPPPVVKADSPSAWRSAANAGVALGRGSTKAGVATGSAFTRFAKKIADSF